MGQVPRVRGSRRPPKRNVSSTKNTEVSYKRAAHTRFLEKLLAPGSFQRQVATVELRKLLRGEKTKTQRRIILSDLLVRNARLRGDEDSLRPVEYYRRDFQGDIHSWGGALLAGGLAGGREPETQRGSAERKQR